MNIFRGGGLLAVVLLGLIGTGCGGGGGGITTVGTPTPPIAGNPPAGGGGGGGTVTTPHPSGATRIEIPVQPVSGVPNAVLAPGPQVQLVNAAGIGVAAAGVLVSVELFGNGGSLVGSTLRYTNDNGVALFHDLEITTEGGFFLGFTVAGLTPRVSSAINVSGSTSSTAATHLAFASQPPFTAESGYPFTLPLQVEFRDSKGRTTPGPTGATIFLSMEGGNLGTATLSGMTSASALNGIAFFQPVTLTGTGVDFRLRASVATPGIAPALSTTFHVEAQTAAAAIEWVVQPGTVHTAVPIAPAVTIRLVDAQGALVPHDAVLVSVALIGGPPGAVLQGTRTRPSASGIVTFPDLAVNRVGAGYQLRATAQGVSAVHTAHFDVSDAPYHPTQLRIVGGIGSHAEGEVVGPVVVEFLDSAGQFVSHRDLDVSLALSGGDGSNVFRVGGVVNLAQGGAASGIERRDNSFGATGFVARDVLPTTQRVGGAAYDPDLGEILISSAPSPGAMAYTPNTGASRLVSGSAYFGRAIAFDANGALRSLDQYGYFGILNKITGSASWMSPTIGFGEPLEMVYDLTLHGPSGDLYAIASLAREPAHDAFNRWLLRVPAPGSGIFVGDVVGRPPPLAHSLTCLPSGEMWVAAARDALTPREDQGRIYVCNRVDATCVPLPSGEVDGQAFLVATPALLHGTLTTTSVGGVATFSGLTMSGIGSGFRITATAFGLTPDASAAFSVVASTAALPTIAFTQVSQSLVESAGAVSVQYQLNTALSRDVRCWLVISGDAYTGLHHTLSGPRLDNSTGTPRVIDALLLVTIPANQLSGVLSFQTIDNSYKDGDRDLLFSLVRPANAALGAVSSQVMVILDND